MADHFCNQCGHKNPGVAHFCSSCGAPLAHPAGEETTITFMPVESAGDVADEELTIHLEELSEGMGILVVKRGPNAGSKFVLDRDLTTAGRHPKSDIFLDDITVSRRHAEVGRGDNGAYRLHDVGSLNGTYLNRERIDADIALSNGDEVQIGKFRLVFMTAGPND